jgi:hypothetical protein
MIEIKKEEIDMIYNPLGVKNEDAALDIELKNPNALLEAFIIDEVSRMNESDRTEFMESAELEVLISEGVIAKNTLIRLSKEDELTRRTKVAALQISREKNDPLYAKVLKYRSLEKDALATIVRKYGGQAGRVAKKTQREYIKNNPIQTGSIRVTSNPMQTKSKLFGGMDTSNTKNLNK